MERIQSDKAMQTIQASVLEHAADLIRLCTEQNITLCSCESLTAGLFCSALGSVPGASAVLAGGLVTYMSCEKEILAHVSSELIRRYGVVSAECARAMAENTRRLMNCNYCVSFTGNAGPSAMEEKPAGLAYCAISCDDWCHVYEFHIQKERNELRMILVDEMIQNLILAIQNR